MRISGGDLRLAAREKGTFSKKVKYYRARLHYR